MADPTNGGESTQRPMTQLDDFRNALNGMNRTLNQIAVSVARLETTSALSATRDTEERVDTKAEDLKTETRLTVLESFKARIQGQVAILAFLTGVFGTAVIYRFVTHP